MSTILENIKSPADLKNLSGKERNELCQEIRDTIINAVSSNGGHLASNLGVVELTVALMTVFDLPDDTIIWDVGHQIYTHKLLTGRYKEFPTIRTKGGLSGFPSRDESEYDPFTTGHSSASISSALGIAKANIIKNDPSHTIAVIGDGSLTGGLAFEGLNNAGRLKKNFIVILNDNKMAISKNVGSMAKYLGYIRTKPGYLKAKVGVEKMVEGIPLIGRGTASCIRKIKNSIKKSIYQTTNVFEDLGFTYYGPYDGHDVQLLIDTLNDVKNINKPVIIHVRTVKGKGYNYAENEPNVFHGVGKFDMYSGEITPSGNNFSSVFGKCLCNMAHNDNRICAITAAMTGGTGLTEFSKTHSDRFFDVGIAEAHAVTFAAGLARKGMIPFFAVYSTFLQRAYDSLLHDVSLQNLKVVIGIDRAGVVGEDGKTHQGVFDVSFMKSIPNVTVFSPAYYDELDFIMQRVVTEDYGLVAIRYPRNKEFYKPRTYISSGKDYDFYGDPDAENVVVTYGRVFSNCAAACEELVKEDGLRFNIVKLNKIIPVSPEAVKAAAKGKRVIFFEEGVKSGSVSEGFVSELLQLGYDGKVKISAIENGFVAHGSMDEQLQMLKLDKDGIKETIKEFIES